MKKLIAFAFLLDCFVAQSQISDTTKTDPWKKIYRATATKINDLVHTKLEVRFDFNKSWMYGKEWVTLHPHFYPTDSLNLDAKGMTINKIAIVKSGKNIPLKYTYDSSNLFITLDKTYKANENYTVYIDYISRPDERTLSANSVAGSKGLYFINPKGEDKNKPTQIWTQGESEFNSAWFPTIDKPNQKTTQEISMTVPAKYVTMSNGLLVNKKSNTDGTRTDTWKMDLPNAPYLFFMGVGDYAIVKDSYKGKEVSYYVEKEYAPLARRIFGLTPEMIAFYSKITGVDYPWPKYVQIVGKDDESFSMENTSNTLHGEFIEQDARQLAEENTGEWVIAHELFHQWFGDYVTCESWSNITLNESFADYSETLWYEYKYGKDEGDGYNNKALRNYLGNPDDTSKTLVRFYYADKDDVFDNVSYPKGGRILNMLRHYVGDSAFFKSLNVYLTQHKFSKAEAQDLRLAFEQVTGQDLNWFWNQWYYGVGHPKLTIDYEYDNTNKTAKIIMQQTQAVNPFRLPFAIDVYEGGSKKRYNVWMQNRTDTFSFPTNTKPDLINVDADKILLCEKTDNKTLDEFIYQYNKAGLYVDRREAIVFALKHQTETKALDFLNRALSDKSWRIKDALLTQLNLDNDTVKNAIEASVMNTAKTESNKIIKADAIEALGKYKNPGYKSIFIEAIGDSSYTVAGNALKALGKIDADAAAEQTKMLSTMPAKGVLKNVMVSFSDESKFDSLYTVLKKLPFGNQQYFMLEPFISFLKNVKNTDTLKKGVDLVTKIRGDIPTQYHYFTDPYINGALKELLDKKKAAGLTEQSEYIQSKLPAEQKS
jgi:aminopeptidase N